MFTHVRANPVGLFDSITALFSSGSKLPKIDIKSRFELMGKSGQGSMSKVHTARDRKTGRMVCVKILDKEKTAKFEGRFVGLNRPNEGTITEALRHKNIVRVLEHGLTFEGEQVLVMEFLDGYGLNFLIETRHKQLEGNRINYLVQMAEGLGYIHKSGYIHRDICPRNIMITKEGVVKYIDFGLAIPYKPEFCKPGNRTGTADYLAPEIIKRTTTDHRVDLFALGISAYEMFVYKRPWETSRSQQALTEHINNPGRDPREIDPKLDDAVAEFLIKSIERDPKHRYQTADDFKEAVLRLPEGL